MSWQLGSFAVVLLALMLAFWWYEHTRAPAKLMAVVATLAALAALGRDAFAAVPDVKPITAIVFVSGLAFGAGPGFAVGAISGLASNVLLGEGPWTPWQMLGWGLVGLIGAALGALTSRRMPPLAIALACAISAEVFNLVLDVYTWTGTPSHTLSGFAVVLGSAAAFDATHVIASFAFGLAFGGVLLGMLMRVRSRLAVSWEPPLKPERPALGDSVSAPIAPLQALGLLIAVPALLLGGPAVGRAGRAARLHGPSTSAPARAAQARASTGREISFLIGAQNADGGFGAAPGQSSGELYSAWAAMGLAAAGRNPLSVRRDGHTVLDSLRGEAAGLQGAGDIERTILALRACGVSVHSLPGGDPVARLLGFRSSDGSFGHLSNLTAFAIFALRAAGYPGSSGVVHQAGLWLSRQQDSDGGFGFAGRGGASDVDDTAAAVQALLDGGIPRGRIVAHAVAFLIGAQNLDGGFPQQPGGTSNAQSSGWAIQALVAAGRDVEAITRTGSRSPLGYLQSLLAPNGSIRYSRTGSQTPVWVTAQALTALAGRPFPITPVSARSSSTIVSAQPARSASGARTGRREPARGPSRPGAPVAGGSAAPRTRSVDQMAAATGALLGALLAPVVR